MRVVISCQKYQDTWTPFLALFEKFHGGPITLLTDGWTPRLFPKWVRLHVETGSWCEMLRKFAQKQSAPFLLCQDDFFLNEPVDPFLMGIGEALSDKADCVRMYPCPGADTPIHNDFFGEVSPNSEYYISCQASWWNPRFLEKIIIPTMHRTRDFEITGSYEARTRGARILSVKRELKQWPMQYICSAINRGKWNPDAIILCQKLGIPIDTSMRPVAA